MAEIIEPSKFDRPSGKHTFEFATGATLTMTGKDNAPLHLSEALLMLDDTKDYIKHNWRTACPVVTIG